MRSALILFVLGFALASAEPQQPRDRAQVAGASGTGVIAGAVTTAEDAPRPLRRVIVTVSGTGLGSGIQTATDADGRFTFEGLNAGRFTITAEKPAFIKAYYGSRQLGAGPPMPIVLAEGQRVTDVTIRLTRGSVVEGTVLDENRVPLASAQVMALRPAVVNGVRRLIPAGVPWATTDDRGRYRIYGLLPGRYAIRATGGGSISGGARLTTKAALDDPQHAADGPAVMRRANYLPGIEDPGQAELLTLIAGEERTGADIVSRLVRASRINGLAVGPSGRPLSNILVGIASVTNDGLWTSPGAVRPGPDGRFTVNSLPPGHYLFFGGGSEGIDSADRGAAPLTLWTSTEVIVAEGDTADAVLQFVPGVRIRGRIRAAGSGRQLDPSALRVELMPLPIVPGAFVRPPVVTPAADGTFIFPAVGPGRYRLALATGGVWTLQSAVSGNRDVLDRPLDVSSGGQVADISVAVTDQPTELSGTLYDSLERPASEYTLIMFSTDRAHWEYAPRRMSGPIRAGQDGSFAIRGLPAGEYYLTAIGEVDASQLRDPAFLETLAAASMKIILADGERKTQNLKLPEREYPTANQSVGAHDHRY
jgi:hypothetical protein